LRFSEKLERGEELGFGVDSTSELVDLVFRRGRLGHVQMRVRRSLEVALELPLPGRVIIPCRRNYTNRTT
jgi:hypothetical protein